MANYYNINRSLEAYELRLIDPDDGQLKSIFDIPSIGSSGQGGYTDLEIDNLVNAKLNIDNPDVNGTLRAGAGGSGGKIINAGSTPESESFYVNGLSTFNGTVKVPVLDASSNIKTSQQVQTNTFNTSAINTKISFNDNDNEYMKYENSVVDATFNGLKVLDNLYTMDIYPQSIRLPYNNKISFIDTDGATDTDYYNDNYINITIDGGIQRINQVIMGNGEHRFYCGDIATADDADLVMKLSNTRIDIYKDLYLNDTLFQQGGGGGGNSGAFSEDVVIADTYQLKTDTISSNGLNDLVFNVDTVGEFLRFQVSDNTVRVPNTRSFLSQNIFTELIQPLAFANDVVFNGGNNTNDAYEAYVRLDASAEKVSISKETKFENAIQLNQGQSIKWTNVFIREVQGATRPEFDLIVNGSTSHLRLWVNGAIKQAITNTTIACKVNIDAEQGITVLNGQQLRTNTINSHTNSNLVIQRDGSTAITLKAGNEVDFSGYVNINNISTQNDTDMAIRRNDEEFIRLFKNETTSDEAIICYKILRANEELKTNTLNTLDDNSLDMQQNGNTFISLQSIANRVQVNRLLRVLDSGNSIQAQLVQSNTGNYMSFTLGNHISAYTSGDSEADPPVHVNGNTLHLNYYSHGDVFLGTNQDTGADPIPTITINKFSSGTGNAFEVQGNSVFSGTVSTNTLNSETGDLVFQRLGTEFFRLNDQSSLVEVAVGHAFSSPDVYANDYLNRTRQRDTVFYGSVVSADARVEYMKWNYTDQSLDFNAPIDNTNIAVIGNIVDTTVSDERLKTNIQDVESNFCDCVKNVKIKTFEYKDEKYKDSDKYGFIAQHLQKHLPKEFDNIVKKTKPKKDEGEAYLSINYMKLSVVLWGALQETLTKVEHLEASVYELQEAMKEFKKPKAKAKAKAKN